MRYDTYKFIFPPRPESAIPPTDLGKYDNGEYCGQIKLNGDACVVATNGISLHVRNRHNEPKTRIDKGIDLAGLHKCPGWIVVCGELLDKSKRGEDGEILKGFALWDVLVWDSKYLFGSTFKERLDLLDNIFPAHNMKVARDGSMKEYRHLAFTDLEMVYRIPTYYGGFAALYNDIILTDVYEGLVLKKLMGKLELGSKEKNNCGWQLKARKVTKIYKF